MSGRVRNISLGAMLAALYIVTTALNPIGYGIIQLRISAIITMLPFYRKEFRVPCIAAVAIANWFSPLGLIDVAAGILLWTLAYYLIDQICRNIYLKCGLVALLSGVIIGGELSLVLEAPFLFNFISISVSQMIVFVIGTVCWRRIL
ncbi:QueT transporter family protein [Anaerotruncus sp. X29]|nr:QueT transporter family protein [Anaerotruncus sp. X29]